MGPNEIGITLTVNSGVTVSGAIWLADNNTINNNGIVTSSSSFAIGVSSGGLITNSGSVFTTADATFGIVGGDGVLCDC